MGLGQSGSKCKLYYNSGTHAIPSWVEIAYAQDVTVPAGKDRVEIRDRSSGYKKDIGGDRELALSFGYTYRLGIDAVYNVLKDSYENDTAVQFAVMDGNIATSGTKGWRFYGEVFGFEDKQEQNTAHTCEVEVGLTEFEEASVIIEPDYYSVP